ncbi:HlyD family efflux transporter periplasmic adaptor subunit [Alteromonas sediminis]|uniref:HlyD family efflux transporter periplasmic adaptor subunit n=1 Tax=Alteromonas sediminis TaxID=2259342 RepID=A0A3N5Y222_9ALTE|nr:efflux RND transporter periplasmic adaptor subunit [Alteromonas sediminis]RPJ67847.1 HlyD family efflux transporter periplasmic adaptor subunit [Alteromonas sediminis]
MRYVLLPIALLFISACGEQTTQTTPVFEVEASDFGIQVSGFGEIEAAQSQKIFSPGRRPMTLAWLKEENSYVEAGDVIARFDAQRIQKDSRAEELELLRLEQEILKSVAQQREQKQEVESDQIFVDHEFDFVERFAIDDINVYSQLEIIDTFANRDFLEAKDGFLNWKESSIDQQHDSQIAVLDIRKSGVGSKFEQLQQALSSLEVVSPFSGLLVFEKDRRGEKPAVGQTIFPGRPIAQIPNLDNMQAKVFVQANDAIDLAEGQSVDIVLDAFPGKVFSGEVKQVSGFPRSIERGNPVTYFELIVTLLEQDKNMMQPGRKLSASIKVKAPTPTLVVPLQTLHHEDGNSYVFLQQGDRFIKRQVTSGRKNLHLVEVTSGLESGDLIALAQPANSTVEGDEG